MRRDKGACSPLQNDASAVVIFSQNEHIDVFLQINLRYGMHLRQLKTFVAIAESGSFHAAAEKMSITQSAVSMQMKNLEETLQLELFERSVRPPRPSNTGLLLLEQAREIVRLYDKILEASPVASRPR